MLYRNIPVCVRRAKTLWADVRSMKSVPHHSAYRRKKAYITALAAAKAGIFLLS